MFQLGIESGAVALRVIFNQNTGHGKVKISSAIYTHTQSSNKTNFHLKTYKIHLSTSY